MYKYELYLHLNMFPYKKTLLRDPVHNFTFLRKNVEAIFLPEVLLSHVLHTVLRWTNAIELPRSYMLSDIQWIPVDYSREKGTKPEADE
jgi:hypothetical protein